MQTIIAHGATPRTEAVRRLLATGLSDSAAADLMFLEAWERDAAPDLAATRRAGQIRRAQPALAAAIRSEVARCTLRRPPSPC